MDFFCGFIRLGALLKSNATLRLNLECPWLQQGYTAVLLHMYQAVLSTL